MIKTKEKFGKRLKELRKSNNISQEKLAELIEITPRNLSKIETGQTFPSVNNLDKITAALNCTMLELFDFEHFQNSNTIKEKLINKINELTDEEVKVLTKIFKI